MRACIYFQTFEPTARQLNTGGAAAIRSATSSFLLGERVSNSGSLPFSPLSWVVVGSVARRAMPSLRAPFASVFARSLFFMKAAITIALLSGLSPLRFAMRVSLS